MCPAPKGNDYAKGYGRPPIYAETEENIKAVDTLVQQYFEYIEGEEGTKEVVVGNDDEGKPIYESETYWIRRPEPPTVTGLTLYLGFADKSTLYDYSKKESFSHSIKRGLSRIEQFHEIKASYGDKCTGNIFVLKNFGWVDRVEQDITSKGEKINNDNEIKVIIKEYGEDE